MYDLFIGNHERVMGRTVFYKDQDKFIPCTVTNYYFASQKYALVPTDDLYLEGGKRRLFYSTKIYLPLHSVL
jgi:hypothetical protein